MLYVIKRPLISEKNSLMSENNVYAFEVNRQATKIDIKNAVEKSFQVKVASVNTMVCRGRAKRTKFGLGKVPYWKKAMVKLSPGEKISLFEGA
ncbi:MAG: 50S ribosomal protein L23 [Bdellovibrionaceae bacterium]|jgi:large subunit ribosomal protein L23|nr:50S ribosomal protein L23 [Pseudobdellovibrionaceae bacterium]